MILNYFWRKYIDNIIQLFWAGKATTLIMFCWIYAIGWSIPPFVGWGKYIPEGILNSCSFDYLTRDVQVREFYKECNRNEFTI